MSVLVAEFLKKFVQLISVFKCRKLVILFLIIVLVFCSDILLFIPEISYLCLFSVLVKVQLTKQNHYKYYRENDLFSNQLWVIGDIRVLKGLLVNQRKVHPQKGVHYSEELSTLLKNCHD